MAAAASAGSGAAPLRRQKCNRVMSGGKVRGAVQVQDERDDRDSKPEREGTLHKPEQWTAKEAHKKHAAQSNVNSHSSGNNTAATPYFLPHYFTDCLSGALL